MSLEGKWIVVTGGTGALGSKVCETFLSLGAHVSASYILDDELANLPEALAANERFEMRRLDLSHESEVEAWFISLPRIDVLVNVAGGFAMAPFTQTSLADWNHMFDMNLKTNYLCSREALKRMQAQDTGRIINVGAFAARDGVAGMSAYSTSKAAVMHLTQSLAEETLSTKITVNAVLPSIMDTPGNRLAMPDAPHDNWTPVANVADTIAYLAKDSSWHITGALIPVRGRV